MARPIHSDLISHNSCTVLENFRKGNSSELYLVYTSGL